MIYQLILSLLSISTFQSININLTDSPSSSNRKYRNILWTFSITLFVKKIKRWNGRIQNDRSSQTPNISLLFYIWWGLSKSNTSLWLRASTVSLVWPLNTMRLFLVLSARCEVISDLLTSEDWLSLTVSQRSAEESSSHLSQQLHNLVILLSYGTNQQ